MNGLPSGSQQEEQPQAPINPVVPNWAGPPVVPVQPFPDLRMLQNWITQSMIQYNAVGSQQIAATNDQAGVLKKDALGEMTWDGTQYQQYSALLAAFAALANATGQLTNDGSGNLSWASSSGSSVDVLQVQVFS